MVGGAKTEHGNQKAKRKEKHVTRNGLPFSFHPVHEAEEDFSELIHTYTIRDYSFYPHTMSAYSNALPGWPSSDNIYTHLAVHWDDAQTLTQMHVHPLKYVVR